MTGARNRNGFNYSDALVPADEIFWGGVVHIESKIIDATCASAL